ncbi:hypothetical protein JCM10135_11890 [Stetteria hydrogenophila]
MAVALAVVLAAALAVNVAAHGGWGWWSRSAAQPATGAGDPQPLAPHAYHPARHGGEARPCVPAEAWNGTATVAWADPATGLLGLRLEDGSNVTVKLARAYVRASDGALVYGGWLASAALQEGSVWVKVAGRGSHGFVVEIEVAGVDYIAPQAYGR